MTRPRDITAPVWLLAGLGGGIVLLTWIALALHVPGSIWVGTPARKDAVVGLMLAAGLLYGAAVLLVTSRELPGKSMATVLAVAAILRISLLLAPPFMSSDIYRYVWDGRVQAAGINPYAYVPADPHLASLRDGVIYGGINRADFAHTIYPPAAQMIFAAVGRLSQTILAMKCAMVLLEACGIFAIWRLLQSAGLPPARLLIYAWNPLAAWAVAGDGHIDGAAIGLLGLALWAACRRRDGWAGALLGAAILTKFLPLAVAPALWRRWGWKMPLACAAVIAAFYACYIGVGWRVFGYLPAYTSEEGLVQGSGFWLLAALGHIAPMPPWLTPLYLGLCATALAALASLIAFSWPRAEGAGQEVAMASRMALLAAALMLAMSPHYPWYFAWLALPCCLSCRPFILWLSVAPLLLYSDPWHDEILIETVIFAPAIILAVIETRGLWRPRHLAAPESI